MFFIKKIFLLLIFLFMSNAFCCETQKWMIEGKKTSLCYDRKLRSVFSEDCSKKKCQALVMLKDASIAKGRVKKIPSQNPGSSMCDFLKGKVLMGYNERQSQNAFCQAPDGSLISLSLLNF